MTDLEQLIADLKAAREPSRELNTRLMALHWIQGTRHIGAQEQQDDGSWKPVMDLVWIDPDGGRWKSTGALDFTSSIDDAVHLVEAMLPDHQWSTGRSEYMGVLQPHAVVWRKICDGDFFFESFNAAMALCIAAVECLARVQGGFDE